MVPLSEVGRVVPSHIPGNLLTILECSNEVQNFLYLSRDFDTSHVGEGMDEPIWQTDEWSTTKCPSVDFRAMVDPSMPLEYAKKHFAPALQTAVK